MDNEKFKPQINNEITRLTSFNLDKETIFNKIKKTYKNRYFIYQKKN